jgi:hypothetical protein
VVPHAHPLAHAQRGVLLGDVLDGPDGRQEAAGMVIAWMATLPPGARTRSMVWK